MGTDGKYGTVTTQFGSIPDDEPVIVFRARDKVTPLLLEYYEQLCRFAGSPDFHLSLISETTARFRKWQEANPEKLRVPDSAAYRERLDAWNREQDPRRRELTHQRDEELRAQGLL